MAPERTKKIKDLEIKRDSYDASSMEHHTLTGAILELKKLLPSRKVKLHVAEEALCESCQ